MVGIFQVMDYRERIGLIAGFGILPDIFAREVKNCDLYIAGFKKNYSQKIIKIFKNYKFF